MINSGDGGERAARKTSGASCTSRSSAEDATANTIIIQNSQCDRRQNQQQDLGQNTSANCGKNANQLHQKQSQLDKNKIHNYCNSGQVAPVESGALAGAARCDQISTKHNDKSAFAALLLSKKSRLGAANDHNYNLHPATEILIRQINLEQQQQQANVSNSKHLDQGVGSQSATNINNCNRKSLHFNETTETIKRSKHLALPLDTDEIVCAHQDSSSPGQMDECMAAMVLINLSTKPTTSTANNNNSKLTPTSNNKGVESFVKSYKTSSGSSSGVSMQVDSLDQSSQHLPKKSRKDLNDDEGFNEELGDVEQTIKLEGEINAMNSMMFEAAASATPANTSLAGKFSSTSILSRSPLDGATGKSSKL